MKIDNIIKEAHETAIEKGWWESDRSDLELLALVHSEVSEAVEAVRHGDKDNLAEELSDIIIRICDMCGAREIDLTTALRKKLDYNKTRKYRHGGKKS